MMVQIWILLYALQRFVMASSESCSASNYSIGYLIKETSENVLTKATHETLTKCLEHCCVISGCTRVTFYVETSESSNCVFHNCDLEQNVSSSSSSPGATAVACSLVAHTYAVSVDVAASTSANSTANSAIANIAATSKQTPVTENTTTLRQLPLVGQNQNQANEKNKFFNFDPETKSVFNITQFLTLPNLRSLPPQNNIPPQNISKNNSGSEDSAFELEPISFNFSTIEETTDISVTTANTSSELIMTDDANDPDADYYTTGTSFADSVSTETAQDFATTLKPVLSELMRNHNDSCVTDCFTCLHTQYEFVGLSIGLLGLLLLVSLVLNCYQFHWLRTAKGACSPRIAALEHKTNSAPQTFTNAY